MIATQAIATWQANHARRSDERTQRERLPYIEALRTLERRMLVEAELRARMREIDSDALAATVAFKIAASQIPDEPARTRAVELARRGLGMFDTEIADTTLHAIADALSRFDRRR